MKIGIIATYSQLCPPIAYGGEVFYWGLAKTLGEMGHEVHLFAPKGSKTPPNGFLHLIESVPNFQIDKACEIRMEKTYHDLLMSMDVVHDCSLDHYAAERLFYLYGKREVINTINGRTYFMPRPPFNVVTGARWWAEEARQNGLNTRMIYWGIDTDFYTPGDEPKEDYFLWLSRFHPSKGCHVALDLAEKLGFRLKVAGSLEYPDHRMYGLQYIERMKGLPKVEYVAVPVDEKHHLVKRDLYRKAKAFLFTLTEPECFGLVMPEAMACGTPVIAFQLGSTPEVILGYKGNTRGGWVCEDMKAMENLLSMDRIEPEISQEELYEHACQFSWKIAAKEYEKLYEEVRKGIRW